MSGQSGKCQWNQENVRAFKDFRGIMQMSRHSGKYQGNQGNVRGIRDMSGQ